MIFVECPSIPHFKKLYLDDKFGDSNELSRLISKILGTADFYLYNNGRKICSGQQLSNGSNVCVTFNLPGGKGGFGSMLRAIGAQIEKTTNREACRDLSGRRLRDINEEQRLKRWIAKEAEREAEKAKRRKERLERLKSQPRHNFVDFEYEKEISELPERIDEALEQGLQKREAGVATKRKSCAAGSSSKKRKAWLDEDISSDTDTDGQEMKTDEDTSCESENSLTERITKSNTEESNTSEGQHHEIKAVTSQETNIKKIIERKKSISEAVASQEENIEDTIETKNFIPETLAQETNTEEAMETTDSILEALTQETNTEETMEKKDSIPEALTPQETNIEETMETKDSIPEAVTAQNINIETISSDETDGQNSSEVINNCEVAFSASNIKQESKKQLADQVSYPLKENEKSIDIMAFNDVGELENLGLEALKSALAVRGLKCGGNIQERAQRLWKVRGLTPEEYPPNLVAKKKVV